MATYRYGKELEIAYEVDVLVVGGGPGGIGAAVSAARNGASVLLIERENCLGGFMTGGLVHSFESNDDRVVKGIYSELCEEMERRNAIITNSFVVRAFDQEQMKLALDDICKKAGVQVLFHTTFIDTIMNGNITEGAVIFSIEGIQAVKAKVVIDATMVASVARSAGAEMSETKKDERENYAAIFEVRNVDASALVTLANENPDYYTKIRDVTIIPERRNGISFWSDTFMGGQRDLQKAIESGEYTFDTWPTIINGTFHRDGKMVFIIWVSNREGHFTTEKGTYITGYCDETQKYDTPILSNVEMLIREQANAMVEYLRKHVRGFEKAVLEQTPNNVGLLVSHIVGEKTCTKQEMLDGAVYDDSVFVSCGFIDAAFERRFDTFPHDVPYGALCPVNIENLLAAGLHISTEGLGERAISTQVGCLASGQAAGTAAAIAVKTDVKVRDVDIKLLQETLRKDGAVVSTVDLEPGTIEEYRTQADAIRAQNGDGTGDKIRYL